MKTRSTKQGRTIPASLTEAEKKEEEKKQHQSELRAQRLKDRESKKMPNIKRFGNRRFIPTQGKAAAAAGAKPSTEGSRNDRSMLKKQCPILAIILGNTKQCDVCSELLTQFGEVASLFGVLLL